MNGAESLLATLVNGGIEVCFTNPGTSEMRFVAALDEVPAMRPVLTLFEGVAAGAADGYARMAGKPASTLLHLGPGLGNALAYLHDARRARVPLVNVVGEHATFHLKYDAPLTSDIAAIARPVSGWVRSVPTPASLPALARECITAAGGPPGQVATLIVPADCSWDPAPAPGAAADLPVVPQIGEARVAAAVERLRSGRRGAILMGGAPLMGEGLALAGAIAHKTGALLLHDTLFTRLESGAGRPVIHRLPYFPEPAGELLADCDWLLMFGTDAPIAFFGYPGRSSRMAPPTCEEVVIASPAEDAVDALRRVADALGVKPGDAPLNARHAVPCDSGPLTAAAIIAALTRHLPEQAIVVDETVGSGFGKLGPLAGANPHDMLSHCGGAIGQGMPVALGAAIACPDRKVVSLQADGSAMYTPQALWSQAREGADVLTVIFNNRRYGVLETEFDRLECGEAGPRARSTLEIDRPTLDFVHIAAGMGVPAQRVDTVEAFDALFRDLVREPGPKLIEAMI